ncbi:Protein kinase domain [Popillia japonica]|uniref:Cyclin-dependent kinase 20 n=1 Tax=Popillia japonica TaxID=7064 RepID=A0AAW1JGG7_POPJA
MNEYQILGRIGQGAHGYVMKGLHKTKNKEVALKKVIIKSLDEGIPKNIMREILALRVLKFEYIVELLDVVPHGMGLVLVMEYLPSSLFNLLKDETYVLNMAQIKCYSKMLLLGVNFMHENSIMHRDLKPANLLITDNGVLKIADLGLARIYVKGESNRQYTHQVATRWYRAPELLYGSRMYTPSVDLWAVGCIIAEMLTRKPLFPGETDIEQLAIVLHTLGTPTEDTWPGLQELPDYNKISFSTAAGLDWKEILPGVDDDIINFIKGFIEYDHSKRLGAKEALNHTYFSISPVASDLGDMPKPKDIRNHFLEDAENFENFYSEFEQLINGL